MPLPSLPALPTWSQTKHTSKVGFDKVFNVVDKLGAPVNKLSNKLGSEAFWPTTLDKESDKAARILRSFCKDGFYIEQDKEEDATTKNDGMPRGKQRVLQKIPTSVIKKAKGLAIFTTMRTGLWISGAGGSGVLVARQDNGDWSPPSGILLHTAGLGFLIGVDIYDCVVVINSEKALEAFTKIRCTLGGEVSAVAGPVGMGGVLETELHKRQAPVYNYLKSRGFYAGVQIDGTVIIERQDENERFYGQKMSVSEILTGKARHPPMEIKTLMATIKAAQGDAIDESALPDAEPTPGDYEVQSDESISRFGLPPSEDDPDPFGAKALEEEGMVITEIKPSGHKSRPSMEAFEYKPAPSSPIFKTFDRQSSVSSYTKGHHKRDSGRLSIASIDRATQTELPPSPMLVQSPNDFNHHSPARKTSENLAEDIEQIDEEETGDHDNDEVPSDEDDDQLEDAQVFVAQAKVVSIPKRIPPSLPPRSPARMARRTSETPTHEPSGLGIDITSHIKHQSLSGVSTPKDLLPPPAPPTDEKIESLSILHYHPKLLAQKNGPVIKSPIAEIPVDPIDEKLNAVHLSPRIDEDHSPSHRSSVSDASNYSRETPGLAPIKLEDNEPPIKLEDNEPKDVVSSQAGLNDTNTHEIASPLPHAKTNDENLDPAHHDEERTPTLLQKADLPLEEVNLDEPFKPAAAATTAEEEKQEDNPSLSSKPSSGLGLGLEKLIPGTLKIDDDESEFHSIPGTPLEGPGSELAREETGEEKEDEEAARRVDKEEDFS